MYYFFKVSNGMLFEIQLFLDRKFTISFFIKKHWRDSCEKCVYVCLYISLSLSTYTYTYINMYEYVCMSIYMYVYVYLHILWLFLICFVDFKKYHYECMYLFAGSHDSSSTTKEQECGAFPSEPKEWVVDGFHGRHRRWRQFNIQHCPSSSPTLPLCCRWAVLRFP